MGYEKSRSPSTVIKIVSRREIEYRMGMMKFPERMKNEFLDAFSKFADQEVTSIKLVGNILFVLFCNLKFREHRSSKDSVGNFPLNNFAGQVQTIKKFIGLFVEEEYLVDRVWQEVETYGSWLLGID